MPDMQQVDNAAMKTSESHDLLIVGGGVNGAGIAADAAGRGLSVVLVEQNDLASSISTISGRMFLGGLRYLENFDLGLVHRSLREREILMRRAPHLLQVRDFVQIHHPERCSEWRTRLSLWLYDLLGGRRQGRSRTLDLQKHRFGTPVRKQFDTAFHYLDCTGNDTRLALVNAKLAHHLGAQVLPRTRLLRARRRDKHWEIELENTETFARTKTRAGALINTSGPWVDELLQHQIGIESRCRSRLVKVTHILTEPLYEGDQAYVLSAPNGHKICVIPMPEGYHLIGSAENEFSGEPGPVEPSASEIAWLCSIINEYLEASLHPDDVVHAYSGLRPLYDDPTRATPKTTRNYLLDLNCPDRHTPLLNVFGGRITNYRHMSEQALQILKPWLGTSGGRWTKHAMLPGGDLEGNSVEELAALIAARFPALQPGLAERLAANYGAEAWEILDLLRDDAAQPELVGEDVLARELEYLKAQEWARGVDDVIWRRTSLGFGISPATRDAIQAWFAQS